MRFINTPTEEELNNFIKTLKNNKEIRACFYLEDDELTAAIFKEITNETIELAEHFIKEERLRNLCDLLKSLGLLTTDEVEKNISDTLESDMKNMGN